MSVASRASFCSRTFSRPEKRVELVQPVAVQRVTVRQFGQERHVPVVVPDGVRDQHVDSLGVLVLRDAVDRVPRDVAHGSVGFRHRERAVPVGRAAELTTL